MKKVLSLSLSALLFVAFSFATCQGQATTLTYPMVGLFGAGNSGYASTVTLQITDASGTVRIAATNTPSSVAIIEQTDGFGNGDGAYVAKPVISNTWPEPLMATWTIPSLPGASFSVIVDPSASFQALNGYTPALATQIGTALPSVAPGASGGLLTGGTGTYQLTPSGGNVGLFAGAIDVPELSPTLKTLSLRAYLVSTGTTMPASTDTWYIAGLYNNVVYYASTTTLLWAWNNGSGWTISSTVGTNGSAYWTTGSGAAVTGTYTAQGTASGVPTLSAHGNSILNAFQPDQAFPANFSLLSIDSSGRGLLQPTQTGVTIPTVTTVGTLTTYTGNTPQTGDAFARLGAPSGASVSADIASVLSAVNGLPAALLATVIDGTFTLKQAQAISLNMSLEATRVVNPAGNPQTINGNSVPAYTAVATWYRRQSGSTLPDYTRPMVVQTTTYAAGMVQVISKTFTFSNLP